MPGKTVSLAQVALPAPASLYQAWQIWQQLPHANAELCEEWLQQVLLPRWLHLCAHAVQHAQTQALTMWSTPDKCLEPLLHLAGEFYGTQMLQAARIALATLQSPQTLPTTPETRELTHFFRTGRWRRATSKVLLTVALAVDAEQAIPMTLHLERLDESAPYAHPAFMWFTAQDPSFRNAIAHASLPPCRWFLEPLPFDAQLRGDSLGGAFALAAQLLQEAPGDYRMIGVLTRYLPTTGQFLPVEQFLTKYEALRQMRRVRLVMVSPAQVELPLPRCRPCATLQEAVRTARQRQRRQRLRRGSMTLALLPMLALAVGLQLGSYRFYVMPSGRLMLQTGIVPRHRIDTGYLLNELLPDRFEPGWRLRWSMQRSEQSDEPYRQIAHALVDPFKKARLYLLLEEPALAIRALPPATTSLLPHRYRRLEMLALLEPTQRPMLIRQIQQMPAPPNDYETALTRTLTLHRLGALTTAQLVRQLKPLALHAPDDAIRLQSLVHIAPHEPDWILQNPALRRLLMQAAVDPTKRPYALAVLAHLSRTHPQQTLPLFEPYRPLVQTEHERLEMLIQAILTRDETLFRQLGDTTEDLFLPSPSDALPLRIAIGNLLTEFARRRPTLEARWDYLLRELRTPLADRWSLYRDALQDALLSVTPPEARASLYAYLQQSLHPQTPQHQRLWMRDLHLQLRATY